MTCLACRGASPDAVCLRCRLTLRRAPDRALPGGILVRSAFTHDGAARALVHRLKYENVAGVAARLAAVMAPLVPPDASAFVPVPRTRVRHLSLGVDPGSELATALGRLTGIPVIPALHPPVWTARRAGPAGRRRGSPTYRCSRTVPLGAVLVDDVVTTGTTLGVAAAAASVGRAITATSAWHSALPGTGSGA